MTLNSSGGREFVGESLLSREEAGRKDGEARIKLGESKEMVKQVVAQCSSGLCAEMQKSNNLPTI